MLWSRPVVKVGDPPERFGIEFASLTLAEIQQLVRAADQKAAIFLTLAAALIGVGGKEAFDDDGLLHAASGLGLGVAVAAGALLLVAVVAGLAVVFPRMTGVQTGANDLLFFGLLRSRLASEVARDLKRLDPHKASLQLASQLVIVSGICWRKHALLRVAIGTLAAGGALLIASLAIES